MKTLKTLALVGAVSVGLLGSGGVMATADNNGDLSLEKSEASFDITLTTHSSIQIWGLDNVTAELDTISNLPEPQKTDFCVYTNNSNYSFDLTVTSPKRFVLHTGADNKTFEYSLNINDKVTKQTSKVFDSVLNETTEFNAGARAAPGDGDTCTSGNMELQVSFVNRGSLTSIPDGTYSDIVTLEVQVK